MRVSPEEKVLIISYIGMKTVELDISKGNTFKVVMEDDYELLDEVVVTGYQSISKERVTGSFAVINTDNLKSRRQTDIMGQLEGQVPGLVQRNGDISIRGLATLNAEKTPLFVVDGMPFEGDFKSINPATITKVTVLKDAAAASIYGARAANGVIVISTVNGSSDGKVHISYDANLRLTGKPRYGAMNLLSTKELIDLQVESFHLSKEKWLDKNRYSMNPVHSLLLQHRAGLLTQEQLDSSLNSLRTLDNRQQLDDFYLQTGLLHQHNIGIQGGNEKHRYSASIDYLGSRGTSKYADNERLGFTLKNTMKFLSWLTADIGVSGDFSKDNSFTGAGTFSNAFYSWPSYYMLNNPDGTPAYIPRSKSEYELNRLTSIGLLDERYSPITNLREERTSNTLQYYRINTGLNFNIVEGLDLDIRFQTENSTGLYQNNYNRNSHFVRTMVNDAAQYDKKTQTLTYNVPRRGGQMSETRVSSHSWTFRPQLKFDKNYGKHSITALAGSELRSIRNTSTSTYYMGFNEYTLAYEPVNPYVLTNVRGTESLGGSFQWKFTDKNYLYDHEDRFVSFYANGSYTLDNKLNLSGSIRIDQSNLFGTDPRYQYRPLWSLGASYDLSRQEFMRDRLTWVDQLKVRVTYGIGGNIAKKVGPYLLLNAPVFNAEVNEFGSSIEAPANPTLRWEKTGTFNVGIDFSLFGSRLNGSLDVYNKNTNDLLANRPADPTLGFASPMMNYGSMRNSGVELSLSGAAIETKDFAWNVMWNFSYNKNTLLNVDESNNDVLNYSSGNTYTVGYPASAVFSFRYAGLNPENGRPQYYTKDNEIKNYILDIEDLVYSGTTIPPFSSSLTNEFSFRGFDFSFMLSYLGGHVVRSEAAPYLAFAPTTNANKSILNRWQKPGDEKKPNVGPAITGESLDLTYVQHPWHTADKHVIKGDHISMRTMSLGYNFDRKLLSSTPIQGVRLTLQAENLFLIPFNSQGINPEALSIVMWGWGSNTFPTSPSFTLGASIQF